MTLDEAKRQFEAELNTTAGTHCPCCGRYSKIYKRKLHSGMAHALILIARYFAHEGAAPWLHVRKYLIGHRVYYADFTVLVAWGLLEKREGHGEDGNPDNGFYRITPSGVAFVQGEIVVPKHLDLLNGNVVGTAQEMVTIQAALGKRFDYTELMRA